MFWDVGAESSPFRNIDYLPELFYLAPPVVLKDGLAVSGQIGVRHRSNGRAGLQSRSLNSIYVAPMASAALGGATACWSGRDFRS
jgi:outer membrane phospholipase A